jgi:hypothetical protein
MGSVCSAERFAAVWRCATVRLPALRQDGFKRAAKEEDTGRQSALDL